jgi:hypothetical protein
MRATVKIHLGLALVGALLGLGACQGAPAPLRPTATTFVGQKARVFPNTPEEVWGAARAALVEQGFVFREEERERGFIHADTIELEGALAGASLGGDARSWTRVTARVDFVDQHKRAPRTMLELEAERLIGTAEGPFEASIGELQVDFYERFFQDVEARLPAPRMPQLAIPGFE